VESGEERAAGRAKADALIGWLREYAERRLNSRRMDERRCVTPGVVLDFGNKGLFGLRVPARYGGCGMGMGDVLRVLEQLAAIDLTLAILVGDHNALGLLPLVEYGREPLRRELLPALAAGRQLAAFALTEPGAGSNPNAIRTVARRVPGGWRLSGEKCWIGLASWAGVISVFARAVDESGRPLGALALAVRQGAPGLRLGPEAPTLGLRGIVQNALDFDDVWVPEGDQLGEAGEGMRVAHDAMMFTRLGIAAFCVGAMKRCAQLMARYARRRVVASGRLLDNPVTLAHLGDLTAAVAATEALTRRVAAWIDAGREVPVEAYVVCKTAAPEFLWQAADRLVQLLGGRGYVETNVAPQLLRDARVLRIFEGPTEPLHAYLGANALYREESITRLLAEGFRAADVAADLREAAERLKVRAADGGPVAQWAFSQAGELAAAAIVRAAIEDRDREAPGSHAGAVAWARRRYGRLRAAALGPDGGPPAAGAADRLLAQVATYADGIGDVEQHLPGEDDRLDDYLAREWPGEITGAEGERAL
jgi:alkylation response protein AidB-like acyl-CoA dehydrogenase